MDAKAAMLEKIMEAIRSCDDQDGASRKYVGKFLKAKYGLGSRTAVKKALDKAIKQGHIEIIEGNNRLRVVDTSAEGQHGDPHEGEAVGVGSGTRPDVAPNERTRKDFESLRNIADDLQEEQDDLRDQIEFALQRAVLCVRGIGRGCEA